MQIGGEFFRLNPVRPPFNQDFRLPLT
jgi:hypothetical protein